MRAIVVKRNKRLFIEDADTGSAIYYPPDFLRHRIQSRQMLIDVADKINETGDAFLPIMNFESMVRR